IIFPSENLHCAEAGGLGRLLLSCWDAAERLKTRIVRNAKVMFLRIKFSLKKLGISTSVLDRGESANRSRTFDANARLDYLRTANVSNAPAEDLLVDYSETDLACQSRGERQH